MLYKIQPAPRTDHITDDGTELTQRPYPIVADKFGTIPEGARAVGFVRVVGFMRDLARQEVDVWWRDAIHPLFPGPGPVGMYVVVQAADSSLSTLTTAVETFERLPDPRRHRSCRTHCCIIHGCKYGHADCPVAAGEQAQAYPCEHCPDAPNTPADQASADELLHHLRECVSSLEAPLAAFKALMPEFVQTLAAFRTSMDELDRKLTHGHPLPGDWNARR